MCAGSFGREHPDREFERHAALDDAEAQREQAEDRAKDHAPSRRSLVQDGRTLYDSPGRLRAWDELSGAMQQAWAEAERFLAFRMRQEGLPGALRTAPPVSAVDGHARCVDAITGVLWRRLEGKLELARGADEAWVREFAEELAAAADTGI